jgi:L-alanine-DL-glutamate epimerase-like enolase superfamily enzyme
MSAAAPLHITARVDRFPIAGAFVISREVRTEQVVVLVEVSDGIHIGRAECVPYGRYGETPEGVIAEITAQSGHPLTREALQTLLRPGAARNGIDCALWDLEAKRTGRRAWELAGLLAPAAGTAHDVQGLIRVAVPLRLDRTGIKSVERDIPGKFNVQLLEFDRSTHIDQLDGFTALL